MELSRKFGSRKIKQLQVIVAFVIIPLFLLILVFVLIGSTLLGTQLAYVLNRFKFCGNALIRNLFTFAALLPGIAMQVSVYQIMTNLHFINTLYGYIIMMCGTDVMSMYIYIQFFENLPVSLDESAFLDGASYFRIYLSILLPLLKPAIVTNLILTVSPERIILAGGVMHQLQLFPMIRERVAEYLNGYIETRELKDLEHYIVPAGLKDDQGIMGAIKLAMECLE